MTTQEYVKRHPTKRNGMLVIGPINEDSHYCIECLERDGELTKVTFEQDRYGWLCPKGHFGQGQKLAAGGVVRGPI